MLGILVAVLISWVLLYFIEKRSILALGLLPVSKRIQQFAIGFLLTSLLCFGVQLLQSTLSSSNWLFNEAINGSLFLEMITWDFKSVLTEELLFRGALLYILIKKIGILRSHILSAIAFGIYHWFSFGILGNIVPMVVVFIGTGLMGYAWALAFSKTESIAMPFGLHLGWNFTFNTIFSNGPLGNGIILSEGGNSVSDWFSLVTLWLVPLIVYLFVSRFISEERREFIN